MSELLRERITKKTRREHTCDICLSKIPKGSQMHSSFYADCGTVERTKSCMSCYDFMAKHASEIFDGDNFVTFEDIREYMRDNGYLPKGNRK